MRAIHWAELDKVRPVLVLTREIAVGRLSTVTVAPITSTVHGISTEMPLDRRNGMDGPCVAKCDHVTSIPLANLRGQCGWLFEDQEPALHDAIQSAFDLV